MVARLLVETPLKFIFVHICLGDKQKYYTLQNVTNANAYELNSSEVNRTEPYRTERRLQIVCCAMLWYGLVWLGMAWHGMGKESTQLNFVTRRVASASACCNGLPHAALATASCRSSGQQQRQQQQQHSQQQQKVQTMPVGAPRASRVYHILCISSRRSRAPSPPSLPCHFYQSRTKTNIFIKEHSHIA